MTQSNSPAPRSRNESPARPPSRARRRPRRQAFDALILLVILGLVGYGIYRYFDEILEALYSRTAMVVLVIMVIEFLILKSLDRTRLYRIENRRLVRRRMADLQAMREAESALSDLIREPPMPPTEVLRRRQLKGSMVVEEGDDEDDPNKTPLEQGTLTASDLDARRTPIPKTASAHDAAPETRDDRPATPSPEATQAARRALRHLRKRIY